MAINYSTKIPKDGLKVWVDPARRFGNDVGPAAQSASKTSSGNNNPSGLPRSAALSPDGTKLFVLSLSGTGTLRRYNLSTAYSVSTASLSQNISANGYDNIVSVSDDFITLTNAFGELFQFRWGTAYDLFSLNLSSSDWDWTDEPAGSDTPFYGIEWRGFSQGGTTFIGLKAPNSYGVIAEFELSTPYDLSTATERIGTEETSSYNFLDAMEAKYPGLGIYRNSTCNSIIKVADKNYIYIFYDDISDNFKVFSAKSLYDTDATIVATIGSGYTITTPYAFVSSEDLSGNIKITCSSYTSANGYVQDVITIPSVLSTLNIASQGYFAANGSRVSIDSDGHFNFDGAGTRVAYLRSSPDFHDVPKGSSATWNWWSYFVDAGNQDHPNIGWETTGSWVGTNGFVFGTGYSLDGPRWGIGGSAVNYTGMASDVRYAYNVWQNWTVVYDGSSGTVKTYLNGKLGHTATGIASSISGDSNTNPIYIGATNSRGGNWNGKMGIVQMWDRTLSEVEVSKLFDSYRGRYGI